MSRESLAAPSLSLRPININKTLILNIFFLLARCSRTDLGLERRFDSRPNRHSTYRVFTGRLSVLLDRLVRPVV